MDTKDRNNFVDYILGIALIFIFSWNPNFAHGYLTGLDEGVHLPWINQILLGKVPYRDFYMVWGPFSEWLPAFFMKVTNVSLTSFRLFYHLSRFLTLLLGFFILKQLLKTRLFVYIGVWLLLTTKVSDFWSTRWGSTRLLFALAAIYFVMFYTKNNKKYFLSLSGIFSGIALFNSQESGFITLFSIGIFLFLFNIYLNRALKISYFINDVLYYLFGMAVVVIPVLIYFFSQGALGDLIRIYFIDIFIAYPSEFLPTKFDFSLLKTFYLFPNSDFAIYLFYFLISFGMLLFSFGYLILRLIIKRITMSEMYLCLIIPFGILFLLTASRQIGGEQLAFCAPIVITVALFMIEKLFLWSRDKKNIFINIGVLFFIISIFSYFFIKSNSMGLLKDTIGRYLSARKPTAERFRYFINEQSHPSEVSARLSGRWYELSLERAEGNYIPEEQGSILTNVVKFIEKNSSPGEPIFVFPHEGQYYFLTNRPSATNIVPLFYAAMKPAYQESVVKDLERNKPRYCIYVQDAQIVPRAKGHIPNELLLEVIYKYIADNYRIIKQYNKTFILERISFLK